MNQCDHSVTDYPVSSSKRIWTGKVFGLREDEVLLPGAAKPVVRQYLDHPGAVAIVALRGESEVLLLRQYRHPVRAKLWEIPAGLLDQDNEEPLAAARRELREEADLEGGQWSVLVDLFTSPGASNESLRIFLVKDPVSCADPFPREDEEADILPAWVNLDEAVAGVLSGSLHNPTTVAGILSAAAARLEGWKGLRSVQKEWMR